MTPLQMLAVTAAGVGAGAVNAVVGSGTLLTFPTLLAIGLPPVTANVTNTVGLVPGSLGAVAGYRRELSGRRRSLTVLAAVAAAGGLTGGLLLLVLPERAFSAIVPVLILLGCVLVLVQPAISRRLRKPPGATAHRQPVLLAGVYLTGIYGGYFGAAQGVLLIALLAVLFDSDLQRANAAKNVLATLVNLTAGVLFVLVADVVWTAALLIAAGSFVGGTLGSRYGRRLPSGVLRAFVVVVGIVAVWQVA